MTHDTKAPLPERVNLKTSMRGITDYFGYEGSADICRAHIAALEAENKRLGDALVASPKLLAAIDYLRSALAYRPEVGEAFDFEGACHLSTVLSFLESALTQSDGKEGE